MANKIGQTISVSLILIIIASIIGTALGNLGGAELRRSYSNEVYDLELVSSNNVSLNMPSSIYFDGTYFYTTNTSATPAGLYNDIVIKFNSDFSVSDTFNVSDIAYPSDIIKSGNYFYIVGSDGSQGRAWKLNSTFGIISNVSLNAENDNVGNVYLCQDYFYVVDLLDDKIYKYDNAWSYVSASDIANHHVITQYSDSLGLIGLDINGNEVVLFNADYSATNSFDIDVSSPTDLVIIDNVGKEGNYHYHYLYITELDSEVVYIYRTIHYRLLGEFVSSTVLLLLMTLFPILGIVAIGVMLIPKLRN